MTEETKRPIEATASTENVNQEANETEAPLKKQKLDVLTSPPSIDPAENARLEALWREILSNPTKRKYDPKDAQSNASRQNSTPAPAAVTGEKESAENQAQKARKKKVALYMSYSGTGYVGMQINPGVPTIELDLLKALAVSGATSPDNAMDTAKIGFVRAARTDKGVHALGQLVSLKMVMDEGVIERLNAALPPQIRVWGYTRVNNHFNAKNSCDSRIYEYLFPTHVLHLSKPDLYKAPQPGLVVPHDKATPEELQALKDYRASQEQVSHLRDILKGFVGTKNHHNFTVGKKFSDKSAQRHIKSFECSEPFMRRDLEWISCKVHGQSFMIHQIRKMVGLALLMVRTKTPTSLLSHVFQSTKMNIPRAPALGLLLERTVYEAYNQRIKNLPAREEGRDPLTFEPFAKEIQEFKETWVYETMVQEELEKGVFDEWTRAVDERPAEYAWFLNSEGILQEDRKPSCFTEPKMDGPEDESPLATDD